MGALKAVLSKTGSRGKKVLEGLNKVKLGQVAVGAAGGAAAAKALTGKEDDEDEYVRKTKKISKSMPKYLDEDC